MADTDAPDMAHDAAPDAAQADERSHRRTSSRATRSASARQGSRRGADRAVRTEARRAQGMLDDLLELEQGLLHAGIEAASATLDTATRVTRNTVDRAFAKDLRDPGDIIRNLGSDTDETMREVLDGMRDVPRRMNDGFYEAVRDSSRGQARGERQRRAQAARDESEEG